MAYRIPNQCHFILPDQEPFGFCKFFLLFKGCQLFIERLTPEIACQNYTIPINQKIGWDHANIVTLDIGGIAVEDTYMIFPAKPVRENGIFPGFGIFIKRHTKNREPIAINERGILVFLIRCNYKGILIPARFAPGCPKIDQHDFPGKG